MVAAWQTHGLRYTTLEIDHLLSAVAWLGGGIVLGMPGVAGVAVSAALG